MANSTTGNGNGSKAFGSIAALVAVLGGVAAIVRPMNQTIEQLQSQVAAALVGHAGVLVAVAAMQQRFIEVETQFRGLREVVELHENQTNRRLVTLEEWNRDYDTDSQDRLGRHDERIKALEQVCAKRAP